MRDLKFKDFFRLSEILKKIDFDISKIKGENAEKIGMIVISDIIGNIFKAEDEITTFLADILEVEKSKLEEMDMAEAISKVKELFGSEKFQSFFTQQLADKQ